MQDNRPRECSMMVRNIHPHPGAIDDLITEQVTATSLDFRVYKAKLTAQKLELSISSVWNLICA
ncbi:hypothetical protein RvY_08805 [Ramazzottius varieornatus]|uniref:Uncharacterized protein n=1 Tax=Ramazzottius varieornatus TaxID=947166 RepID=A0A1D1VCQ7_RAMVA|nr:hypothetical protein RvY_08805 [Ramazzottius varieornatus]